MISFAIGIVVEAAAAVKAPAVYAYVAAKLAALKAKV